MAHGLKKYFPDIRFSGNYVTPDEIDRYETYDVVFPGYGATDVGTAAGGTAGAAKALVLINANVDYPRTLAGGVQGTSDMGGVWVINGVNQFGVSQSETITVGTAANGATTNGTLIFARVASGTFTLSTAALGNGSAKLTGVVTGTSAWFGLPMKIASTLDVKAINWTDELLPVAINGGTIGAYVDTARHAFRGTEDVDGTQTYHVLYRPTFNAENHDGIMSNLT